MGRPAWFPGRASPHKPAADKGGRKPAGIDRINERHRVDRKALI